MARTGAPVDAVSRPAVHAVIGGFHIVRPLNDDYINKAIEEFRQLDPDYLITAHCTGDRFYDLACEALCDKVIHSAAGTRFRIRECLGSSRAKCLLLAQSKHPTVSRQCPVLGVKRTWRFQCAMSAFDPYREASVRFCCDARFQRWRRSSTSLASLMRAAR